MLVPSFWSEASAGGSLAGKAITVHRFGWSTENQSAADELARERAEDGLRRTLAGEMLPRSERRAPYNGADGLPIREELLESHGDGSIVVTRNSYGAQCLNVEDVLFADVDFDHVHWAVTAGLAVLGMLLGLALGLTRGGTPEGVLGALAGALLGACWLAPMWRQWRCGPEQQAEATRQRLLRFLKEHPQWRVRLYRTPNGMRALAMHSTLDPVADRSLVESFFRALRADPHYVTMCRLQRCFRARLTPKPWRIGIADHLKPRPGVWPIDPERLPEREAWVARYERLAGEWAACRWLETLGSERQDPKALQVRDLHDERCGALLDRPLA